jgi:hypothetical protein
MKEPWFGIVSMSASLALSKTQVECKEEKRKKKKRKKEKKREKKEKKEKKVSIKNFNF